MTFAKTKARNFLSLGNTRKDYFIYWFNKVEDYLKA